MKERGGRSELPRQSLFPVDASVVHSVNGVWTDHLTRGRVTEHGEHVLDLIKKMRHLNPNLMKFPQSFGSTTTGNFKEDIYRQIQVGLITEGTAFVYEIISKSAKMRGIKTPRIKDSDVLEMVKRIEANEPGIDNSPSSEIIEYAIQNTINQFAQTMEVNGDSELLTALREVASKTPLPEDMHFNVELGGMVAYQLLLTAQQRTTGVSISSADSGELDRRSIFPLDTEEIKRLEVQLLGMTEIEHSEEIANTFKRLREEQPLLADSLASIEENFKSRNADILLGALFHGAYFTYKALIASAERNHTKLPSVTRYDLHRVRAKREEIAPGNPFETRPSLEVTEFTESMIAGDMVKREQNMIDALYATLLSLSNIDPSTDEVLAKRLCGLAKSGAVLIYDPIYFAYERVTGKK